MRSSNGDGNVCNLSCLHLSSSSFGSPSILSQLISLRSAMQCGKCGQAQSSLYGCITCSSLFCKPHAHLHALEMDHSISLDIDRVELYCCFCKDQLYDRDFDRTVLIRIASDHAYTATLDNNKRPCRLPYTHPPFSIPPSLEGGMEMGFPCGLRGINNLGNTCFMNSVLQALLHTPPLRNFFLTDNHNRYMCANNVSHEFCLACELDGIFSLAFSGTRTPFTPANFLYTCWRHAANLASYQQQDAHEFFISILDALHQNLHTNKPKVTSDCCIAHKVFSGVLRSDVMCTACGFTSTTYDPCVDISLDLEPNKGTSAKTSKKSKQNSGNIDLSQNSRMATLMGCLDRFTRPERLGSDQKFFCQQCQVRQESLKQMSIRKLPVVSCFHIKRFEHSSFRKMTRKVDSYLQFPFSLDLAPYLSSSILKSRFGNRMFYFDEGESDASNEFSSEFELFAVITHKGRLDAGHYVTYLRLSNQWYKCDDAWITQVSENVVRASQGYMMFYVQKMLYYKASESSEGSDKPA